MNEHGPADASNEQLSDVQFRNYVPGDILACARLARDAWPVSPAVIASDELELSGMESYMEYSLGVSNWADIAYTPEGVVGFLFGRIDGYLGKAVPKRSPFGELSSIAKSIVNHEHSSLASLGFIWSLTMTELKLKLMMPRSDASIEMFIVGSNHRGRGIGGELFKRYMKTAIDSGSSLVTVYTDDQMSNWSYYEKRGFERIGTFYDNITSHYSGSRARGIIFALDLRRWNKDGCEVIVSAPREGQH